MAKELRVYAVTDNLVKGYIKRTDNPATDFDSIPDEVIVMWAEQSGMVYSVKGFETIYNKRWITLNWYFIRILEKSL